MRTDCEYPSDLSDGLWRIIRRLLPKWSGRGRRPICCRWVINAILYFVRTGCQWRQLPHDFPNANRQVTSPRICCALRHPDNRPPVLSGSVVERHQCVR